MFILTKKSMAQVHPVLTHNQDRSLQHLFPIPESSLLYYDEKTFHPRQLESILKEQGMAFFHLPSPDPEGKVLQKMVAQIGVVNPHNQHTDSGLWPIKYDQAAIDSGIPARSQTDKEFPMHTDCCFEDKPPRVFALEVVHADQKGGGKNRLVSGKELVARLSPQAQETLEKTTFRLKVPPEFRKEVDYVEGPLMAEGHLFRYRRDCILDEYCSQKQLSALAEVEAALQDWSLVYDIYLPEQTLMFLDNARYLHARDAILDRDRHLWRMRFHPQNDQGQVWLSECSWGKK